MWALFNDNWTQITVIISIVTIAVVGYLIYYVMGHMRRSRLEATQGHAFDGIIEGLNPTPIGLHFIMIGLVAFAFWYVSMGYPLWNWTQAEQYDEEIVAYNANFDQVWKGVDESTLKAMGESIFNSKCVACHGITGEGQNGVAANLLEFGNEAHVIYVMKNGSKGGGYLTPAMPAQASTVAAMFGEENLDKHLADTAAYVISLSGRTPKSGDLNNGEQVYKAVCVACHGADGQGMGATGTIPNFAKNLTTYGTPEDIIRTLKNGKKGYIGEMPNFAAEGTMSALQYKAVATFVSKELNY